MNYEDKGEGRQVRVRGSDPGKIWRGLNLG